MIGMVRHMDADFDALIVSEETLPVAVEIKKSGVKKVEKSGYSPDQLRSCRGRTLDLKHPDLPRGD